MSFLSHVTTQSKPVPPLMVIHGDGGVGKSTFAAHGREPLFIPFEDGLAGLQGVARTPRPKDAHEIIALLDELIKEDHPYKTLIIDSADWMEPILESAACEELGLKYVSDLDYGKGYAPMLPWWSGILIRLSYLRNTKGVMPIIICHSRVSPVPDPHKGEHPQWNLKLYSKAAAKVTEWADIIGFAAVDYAILKEKGNFGKEEKRPVATGDRTLHLQPSPAFVAKNKFGMPASIPLDWSAFTAAYLKATTPTPTTTKPEEAAK